MDLSRKLLKKYLMPQRSLKIYKQSQNILVLLPQRSVVGEKKKDSSSERCLDLNRENDFINCFLTSRNRDKNKVYVLISIRHNL